MLLLVLPQFSFYFLSLCFFSIPLSSTFHSHFFSSYSFIPFFTSKKGKKTCLSHLFLFLTLSHLPTYVFRQLSPLICITSYFLYSLVALKFIHSDSITGFYSHSFIFSHWSWFKNVFPPSPFILHLRSSLVQERTSLQTQNK